VKVNSKESEVKLNEEKLYWHFKRSGWYVPALIAITATPFMILAITTQNSDLEIFAKSVWLILVLSLLGYNLLIRSLRKKFENPSRKF
jgi:ABC-type phosphate transport system permease subunit